MKKIVLLALIFLVFSSARSHAFSPRKKIIVGAVLIGTGALLTYEAVDRCLLQDCGDAQAAAGLVLVGTGATLIVWGLVQKAHSSNSLIAPLKPQPNFQFGFAPRKRGVAAGAILRW